ncbi:NusB antitermination factor [Rubritalea squalenifaciens DSM 18772]|uniref:Transcription antitermination protein NusB n=1 Tax=Rubritalea squalenifaciens DSM 18772 TaxID=1123071 RepID=A0A1M6NMU9_9BACT|nr:transcription antitermination factor NusB [Rubritalea squalenifaciens]SHJ97069.1 NusB antitermination factor [Rubritalea squalenifaciens DSM 18772]
MHSRREIRESAIQFLYSSDLEGGASAEDLCETFWALVLESDHNKLTKATVKAILHFNQGRQGRFTKLIDRAPEADSIIGAHPDAEKLKLKLAEILKLENNWQALVDRIKRLFKPDSETADPELLDLIEKFFSLNRSLTIQRREWNLLLQDFPVINRQLESIKASINALQRVSDRIDMVESPDKFPDHPDIKHLRETSEDLNHFRKEVDSLSSAVLNRKADLDSKIAEIVSNYRPERIDPVDRAILRLGIYEICFREDIPTPVAINEAIEISRRFGSTDSPRFINGVLDAIAKGSKEQIAPVEPSSPQESEQ